MVSFEEQTGNCVGISEGVEFVEAKTGVHSSHAGQIGRRGVWKEVLTTQISLTSPNRTTSSRTVIVEGGELSQYRLLPYMIGLYVRKGMCYRAPRATQRDELQSSNPRQLHKHMVATYQETQASIDVRIRAKYVG